MNRSENPTIILPEWITPVILLVASGLCYGLLLPKMGFYWDDWPTVWFNHIGGTSIFTEVYSSDRPLLGRLFMLTMSMLGSSILRWQVFALFMRWLVAIAFWVLIRITWPGRPQEAIWAALIFTVYPAFSQQWIAVTYSPVFLIYLFFLTSLILMLYVLRKPAYHVPLTAAALILSGLAVFSAEYFIGLEILRPVLIWLILAEDWQSRKSLSISNIRQIIKLWLPYIILLLVFITWRIFIQGFPRGQIQVPSAANTPPTNILDTLASLFAVVVQDGLEVLAGIWGIVFHPATWLAYTAPVIANGVWVIAILGGIFFALTFLKIGPPAQQQTESWGIPLLSIGFLSLFAGGLPFWAINLPYKPDFPYDRTALPMMFGASLILIGTIDLILKDVKAKSILIAIFIAGAICFHYNNAAAYVKDNEDQRTFFWQLYWRVPDLEPGTALLSYGWPFKFDTDNSLTAPLNWIYGAQNDSRNLKTVFIDVSARIGKSLPGIIDENTGRILIDHNQPIHVDYRAARFDGNTNRIVAFIYRPPACLHILDPQQDAVIFNFPEPIYDLIPLSKPELISSQKRVARPPFALFGKEQKKDWCLFYEEADLARQQKKWDEIVRIGKIAFDEHHFQPIDPGEYLPFIEGYARAGDFSHAKALTEEAYIRQRSLQPALCHLWEEFTTSKPASLGCIQNE